jgi:hypothetical protein
LLAAAVLAALARRVARAAPAAALWEVPLSALGRLGKVIKAVLEPATKGAAAEAALVLLVVTRLLL